MKQRSTSSLILIILANLLMIGLTGGIWLIVLFLYFIFKTK